MGTTLNGTTPQNTYPSLIKVGDNTALNTTLKTISDGQGNDTPLKIATDKVEIGDVSYTEIQYLNGVTSAIQTQLNAKQATITGAATTIDTEDLTASRALVSDGSGKVAVSDVTATELGYLDGVTSAVQTQVDAKQATLVSGTNIKTINNESILGSGNITISGGGGSPSGVAGAIQFSDGSAFASDAANLFYDDTNNRLGVGINTPTARLHVKGSGTTSATTALLVQNSAGTAIMTSRDDLTTLLGGGLIMPNFVNITSGSNSIGFETSRINFNATAGTFNNQYAFNFNDGGGNNTGTSGTVGRFSISSRFAPTSGTCVYNTALITPIINQTGGANGITRGLYINPTLTAAADFRAIEVTEGNVLIGNAVANTAKLAVKGNGTSGSTTAFRVQNSAGQTAFNIFDNLIVSVQQDLQLGNTTIFWQSGYQIRNKANGLIITGAAGAATGALGLGMSSGTDVNSKAVLELASTTKGFLPPRMTTTQKNAIATPPAGLVVYDTDLNKLCLYTTAWETITSS
jgi:hypothetical protein